MNCGHQIETLFLLHRFTIPFVKMFWKNETNQHLFLRGHETNCNITKIAIMISVPNLLVYLFKFNHYFPLRHHCSAVPSSHLRCFFQEYLFKIIALFCLPDQNFPYEDSMLSLSLSRVFEFSILSMAILVIWAESYWRSFCEFLPGSLFSRFFLLPVMASTYFRYTAVHFLKTPPLFSDLRFLALHSTTSSLSYLVSSLVSVDSQFVFLIYNSCILVASFCLDSTLFTFLCCLAISWPHLLQCLLPSGKQGSRPSVYSACYLVQLVAGRAVAPVCTVPAT